MLKIKPSPLIAAMVADMRQALEAIRASQYTAAHDLLESRCEPASPLLAPVPPHTFSIGQAHAYKKLIAESPVPLGSHTALMAEVVAFAISKYTAVEHAAALTPEDVATLAAMCSQFGLTVSWETMERRL